MDSPDGRAYFYQLNNEIGGATQIYLGLDFRYDNLELYSRVLGFKDLPDFRIDVLEDINTWVEQNGHNIIYVYGAEDPYSTYQFTIGRETNAVKFIVEDQYHEFSLKKMDEYNEFYKTLMDRLN